MSNKLPTSLRVGMICNQTGVNNKYSRHCEERSNPVDSFFSRIDSPHYRGGRAGLSILITVLLCFSCTQKRYYEDSGTIFNTYYSIKYESYDILSDKINKELQDFNLTFNPFNPNSTISKVNRNEEVLINDLFINVFNKAVKISEISGGAFDVTASPLINLWGFGFEQNDSISQQAIDSIKIFVGYKKIRIENKKVIKDDPRITLNFSAIAKGYASDVIGALLEREGVKNYMVCIGGDGISKGKNPKGICWHWGINKPEDDVTGSINDIENVILLCSKRGIATSGNYRNFYIKDGKKYGHIIDPRTGYPSEQSITSASVIAPDGMTADAFATAFMVMGVEAACQLAETIPGIDYYLIYPDDAPSSYQAKYSKGIRSMLKAGRIN